MIVKGIWVWLAATAGLLLGTGEAAVTVSLLPLPVVLSSAGIDFDPHYYTVDLDGDMNVDYTLGYEFQGVALRSERANRFVILTTPPPDIGGPVAALVSGFVITSSALPFGFSMESSDIVGGYVDPNENSFATIIQCLSTGCTTRGFNGQRGYIGVEFELADGTHYGWIDLEVPQDFPTSILYGWAWETTPNTPIVAGAGVPEPSRVLLLLAGGALLSLKRRRAK